PEHRPARGAAAFVVGELRVEETEQTPAQAVDLPAAGIDLADERDVGVEVGEGTGGVTPRDVDQRAVEVDRPESRRPGDHAVEVVERLLHLPAFEVELAAVVGGLDESPIA